MEHRGSVLTVLVMNMPENVLTKELNEIKSWDGLFNSRLTLTQDLKVTEVLIFLV